MTSERPSESPAKTGGFPRLTWVAAGIAAFASYQIGPVIAFWAAQMKGAPADLARIGETPHLHFLNKAMSAGKPAAIAGAIVAVVAAMGAAETTPGLRVTIMATIAGTIGGCIVGFLVGYF
jgi:hypothetical protein